MIEKYKGWTIERGFYTGWYLATKDDDEDAYTFGKGIDSVKLDIDEYDY